MFKRWGLLYISIVGSLLLATPSFGKSSRENRLDNTFLLRHKASGKVASFHKTSPDQLWKAASEAGMPRFKISDCKDRAPSSIQVEQVKLTLEEQKEVKSSEEIISQRLELAILLEAFTTRQQKTLTDSQRDWVKNLNTCDLQIRNGLRALALMMSDYELLKAAAI